MTTKRADGTTTFVRAGIATLMVGMVLAVTGIAVAPASADAPNPFQIEVCHATGSVDNPYTTANPNKWQITSPNGHGWDDGDIIPPFDAGSHGNQTWDAFPGLNWEGNEAFYDAGCGELETGPRTGDVTLAKLLAGGDAVPDPAPTSFEFTVECDSGTVTDATPSIVPGAAAVTVANDVELDDTCTITETPVPTNAAVTFDIGTSGTNSTTVTIESTNGVAVTATNTYTSTGCTGDCDDPTGSLSVDKVVDGNNQPAGQTFPFTVTCTVDDVVVDLDPDSEGTQASFDLTDAADPHVVSGIPTDATCTVAETNAMGAQQTTVKVGQAAATPGASASGVTVAEDTTTAVVVTNTFNSAGCTVDCGGGPNPSAILSASRSCATGGILIAVSNAGDAPGAASILSGMDQPFSHALHVLAGDSDEVLVPIAEDSDYLITVTDAAGSAVATFRGPKDCVTVGGIVVRPPAAPTPVVAPVDPTPAVQPVVARPVEVAGVVQTRELPRTGADSLPLAQLGAVLVLLGAAVLVGSRRLELA